MSKLKTITIILSGSTVIAILSTAWIVPARIRAVCPEDVHPSALPGVCHDGISYALSAMTFGSVVLFGSFLIAALILTIVFFIFERLKQA